MRLALEPLGAPVAIASYVLQLLLLSGIALFALRRCLPAALTPAASESPAKQST